VNWDTIRRPGSATHGIGPNASAWTGFWNRTAHAVGREPAARAAAVRADRAAGLLIADEAAHTSTRTPTPGALGDRRGTLERPERGVVTQREADRKIIGRDLAMERRRTFSKGDGLERRWIVRHPAGTGGRTWCRRIRPRSAPDRADPGVPERESSG